MVFYGRVQELRQLLSRRDESIPLDLAALQVASIEFPSLDPSPSLAILDSHARELSERLSPGAGPEEFVAAANRYFFETLGFRGNADDYYNPRNSCLNDVLVSRTGLPITLAVLYMEVSRRIERPVAGIPLPGHFLAQYRSDNCNVFIDCFNGRSLTFEECRTLALEVSKVDIFTVPSVLKPASNWQIIVRMLNNLRSIYIKAKAHAKAVQVLDLLIEAMPETADQFQLRGLLHAQLNHSHLALTDLVQYLKLAPQAEDRAQVEEQVTTLRRYMQSLN